MPELSHTIAYRAVEGAVRNALHGHPKWRVPEDFARSVAKRAAGTLMAHAGPSLLAPARRSGQRRLLSTRGASGAGPLILTAQLSLALAVVTNLVSLAHQQGDHDRYIELVTAARILKRELKRIEKS